MFQYNTAEKGLQCPKDFEREEGYDVSEAVRSVLNSKQAARAFKAATVARPQVISPQQSAKIQKLRSQFSPGRRKSNDNTSPRSSPTSPERKLGTLNIKRTNKISIQDAMALDPLDSMNKHRSTVVPGKVTTIAEAAAGGEADDSDEFEFLTIDNEAMSLNEFESHESARGMEIDVNDATIVRGATALSNNEMVVDPKRRQTPGGTVGTARALAVDKKQ